MISDIHLSPAFNDPVIQWQRVLANTPPDMHEELGRVFALASRAHSGQWRKTATGGQGVPYIVHPLRIVNILAEEWKCRDARTLSVALLHDTIEDGEETIASEIEVNFGNEICDGVYALTKPQLPEPCPPETKAARYGRYFAILRAAPAWVRLVKCADRVDNLRDALLWGNREFWEKYSSETIGWHLYLAKETAPIAEVALFHALVNGERRLRGAVPIWADGILIDPAAARLIPEHIARYHRVVGLAMRGGTLVVGMEEPEDTVAVQAVVMATGKHVEPADISREALQDALSARLFREVEIPDI